MNYKNYFIQSNNNNNYNSIKNTGSYIINNNLQLNKKPNNSSALNIKSNNYNNNININNNNYFNNDNNININNNNNINNDQLEIIKNNLNSLKLNKSISYIPHTLKEYKALSPVYLGGLGSEIGSKEWYLNKEKRKKMEIYSNKVTKNFFINSKIKRDEPNVEYNNNLKKSYKLSSRYKASEYCKNIMDNFDFYNKHLSTESNELMDLDKIIEDDKMSVKSKKINNKLNKNNFNNNNNFFILKKNKNKIYNNDSNNEYVSKINKIIDSLL